MYLETITSPADVKRLPLTALPELAKEIRAFILETVSHTGGHLASNLGVVELTIMLHYVYESPVDKFIFDVGHQTYTHKILTGRKDEFNTLRKKGGVSGFPKRSESPHDIAETGHASNSISVALGIEVAERMNGGPGRTFAVIGDGSITGGLAFEGLENAGHIPNNLVIILNNNEMSIGANSGAFSQYLNRKIAAPSVQQAAANIENLAGMLPFGDMTRNWIKRLESSIKAFVTPGMFFRDLGFKYLGPVDGNDMNALYESFTYLNEVQGPVVLQVNTRKGSGYLPAEENPAKFHGIGAFDRETGEPKTEKKETFSSVFGESIVEAAREDERIVGISAAMTDGTGFRAFANEFPRRYFDVGIAEEHALAFASGLALNGKRPVVALYSTFLQRAYDNLIHDVAIMNLPVIVCIDRAGFVPEDGATHQGIFDIAFLRLIPNLTIFAPTTKDDFKKIFAVARSLETPVAIRYPKDTTRTSLVSFYPETISPGRLHVVKEGTDGAVVTLGTTLIDALTAVEALEGERSLALVNLVSAKPLDEEGLVRIAKKYSKLLIIEEGVLAGGVGEGALEALARRGVPCCVTLLGAPDAFPSVASRAELLRDHALDAKGIENACREFFAS